MLRRDPPISLPELEARAAALTGLSLARLAAALDAPVPDDLRWTALRAPAVARRSCCAVSS